MLIKMMPDKAIMIEKKVREVTKMIYPGVVSKSSGEGAKNKQNVGSGKYYGGIWLVRGHGQVILVAIMVKLTLNDVSWPQEMSLSNTLGNLGSVDDVSSNIRYRSKLIEISSNKITRRTILKLMFDRHSLPLPDTIIKSAETDECVAPWLLGKK